MATETATDILIKNILDLSTMPQDKLLCADIPFET